MAETLAALDVDEDHLNRLGRFLKSDCESSLRGGEEGELFFGIKCVDGGRCIVREGSAEVGDAEAAVKVGEPRGAAP